MTDSPFTTSFASIAELLDGVDIDAVDDIETMLMHLLQRPVTAVSVEDAHPLEAIRVTVWAGLGFGSLNEFPLSVADLARDGAASSLEAGPHEGRADSVRAAASVKEMSDDELVAALGAALGIARLFRLTEDDD